MVRLIALLLVFSAASSGIPVRGSERPSILVGSGGEQTMMAAQVREIVFAARAMAPHTVLEVGYTGGTYDNLKRLQSGEIGAALVAVDALKAGHAPPNTAILWVQEAIPLVMAVRADLGVEDLRGVTGRRIVSGGAGSSLERLGPRVYESLGVRPEWRRSAWGQIAYLLKSGQADGFIASPRMVEAIRKEFGVPALKVVRLTSDDVRRLGSMDPDISLSIVMVDGMPVSAWGIRGAMVSRADLPDDISETLTLAARRTAEAKDDAADVLRWLTDGTVDRLGLPVHPGSLRALSRKASVR